MLPLTSESNKWWRWTGSNRRHYACKAYALPTELHPQFFLERSKGIEPLALAWKARVLPLYEPRILFGIAGEIRTPDLRGRSSLLYPTELQRYIFGATGQNRTGTPLWRQILSLLRLPITSQSLILGSPTRT